jgi:hypothetical protein
MMATNEKETETATATGRITIDNNINNDVEKNLQRNDVVISDGSENASGGDSSDSKKIKSNGNDDDDDDDDQHQSCLLLSSYFKTKLYSIPFAFRELFSAAITKIFFGGFLWQSFAFICTSSSSSSSQTWIIFALVTGFGDAIGVFVGNIFRLWMESASAKYKYKQKSSPTFIILRIFFTPEKYPGHNIAFRETTAVSIGAFCSGFAWQPMVDFSQDKAYTFNTTMALVGAVCGALFFVGYAFGIYICVRRNVWNSSYVEFIRDITLALCVMGSTGFFVGTDINYPKNWLRDIVGVRDEENHFLDCLKAGFSTFLGFMVIGTILICIIPTQYLWTTARYNININGNDNDNDNKNSSSSSTGGINKQNQNQNDLELNQKSTAAGTQQRSSILTINSHEYSLNGSSSAAALDDT